mmetsp:Transcript_56507/g.85453  ORF Transcript_56507/g.85453 Transcript_56507/m.85453 type:complete len:274 (-) Transcript_56507:331-1152(-)
MAGRRADRGAKCHPASWIPVSGIQGRSVVVRGACDGAKAPAVVGAGVPVHGNREPGGHRLLHHLRVPPPRPHQPPLHQPATPNAPGLRAGDTGAQHVLRDHVNHGGLPGDRGDEYRRFFLPVPPLHPQPLRHLRPADPDDRQLQGALSPFERPHRPPQAHEQVSKGSQSGARADDQPPVVARGVPTKPLRLAAPLGIPPRTEFQRIRQGSFCAHGWEKEHCRGSRQRCGSTRPVCGFSTRFESRSHRPSAAPRRCREWSRHRERSGARGASRA